MKHGKSGPEAVGNRPGARRSATSPEPTLIHEGRGGMQAAIPTVGGELRVRTGVTDCHLEAWSTYPDGHAMMAGGLRLDAQTLRVLLHTLKVALHHIERAEAAPVRRAAA